MNQEEIDKVGKLQECDLCHDIFNIRDLKLDFFGIEFYCEKCRKEKTNEQKFFYKTV